MHLLYDLHGAAAAAQAAHLEHIHHVEEIGRTSFGYGRCLDRFQQTLAIDRLGENFRLADFEALFRRGIGRQEQGLDPGENLTQQTAEREPIDRGTFQLREKNFATGVLATPAERGLVALDQLALMLGVILHHCHQLSPHLSVVVDDEQLHH
ncbi:MAG: hypothetical protein M3N12_01420 [Verrucomicrobiota bacterium]|nr:hypothetical protein [Verrucomicrobiota bacterium]